MTAPARPVPALPDPGAADALLALATERCWRRAVLTLGEDAPRAARIALACRAAGARRVQAAHPSAPDAIPALLRAEAHALHLWDEADALLEDGAGTARAELPGSALDVDARPGWWLRAEAGHPDLAEWAGFPEVVLDLAPLCRWADPLARLRALRGTGARRLLLECPLAGAVPEGLPPDAPWCAEALSPAQHRALDAHWRGRGVAPAPWARFPAGFTAAQLREARIPPEDTWLSPMARGGFLALLAEAGLRVLAGRDTPLGLAVAAAP